MRYVRGLFGRVSRPSRLAIFARPRRAAPEGQMTWAVHVSLAPTWFDPAETSGIITPLHGALRPARRAGEADAGQPDGAEPGRVVERVPRRARLRLRPAPGGEVPQRRPRHRRGRQVLARALPGRRPQDAQGAGGGGRDAGSRARAHPPQAAVARLHDLLHGRHRRRLDRAQEVRREGRRRRLQEGARSAPAPTSSSRSRRAWSSSSRPSISTGGSRRA